MRRKPSPDCWTPLAKDSGLAGDSSRCIPAPPRPCARWPTSRPGCIWWNRSPIWLQLSAKHAKAVITDSGGITEETTVMGVPCLTLRDSTERPETVTIGTNELIGTDPDKPALALARLMAGQWKQGAIPELWDGRTAERIVAVLEKVLSFKFKALIPGILQKEE